MLTALVATLALAVTLMTATPPTTPIPAPTTAAADDMNGSGPPG
jgi:hypothetical protein